MSYDEVLYIIGNGFDLHHQVKSSYKDFSIWLRRKNPQLYMMYSAVCNYKALWSDFETSMAYVNRDYLLECGKMLLPDPKKDPDDYTVADIMLGGDHAQGVVEELLSDLRIQLHKWICSITPPRDYDSHKLQIDANAHFLSFNYTTFLETHYGIEHERINYIHGNKAGKWGTLVLGHGEDNQRIFDKWFKKKYNTPHYNKKGKKYYTRDAFYHAYHDEAYLPEYEMITEAVEDYYHEAQKDVETIIRKNNEYFQTLSNIRHIYVWGYSFSSVDIPYLRKIVEYNTAPSQLRWHVSYYSEKDRNKAIKQVEALGFPADVIELKTLDEWRLPHNIK